MFYMMLRVPNPALLGPSTKILVCQCSIRINVSGFMPIKQLRSPRTWLQVHTASLVRDLCHFSRNFLEVKNRAESHLRGGYKRNKLQPKSIICFPCYIWSGTGWNKGGLDPRTSLASGITWSPVATGHSRVIAYPESHSPVRGQHSEFASPSSLILTWHRTSEP